MIGPTILLFKHCIKELLNMVASSYYTHLQLAKFRTVDIFMIYRLVIVSEETAELRFEILSKNSYFQLLCLQAYQGTWEGNNHLRCVI